MAPTPDYLGRALELMRAGFRVRRFHTRTVLAENTVGAHSAGVAGMLWLLYLGTGETPPARLLLAALAHDLPEHILGDVPAPTKRALNTSGAFDAMETELLLDAGLCVGLTEDEERLLKLADVADALAYIAEEQQRGNRTLNDIADRYWAYWSEIVNDANDNERDLGRALAHLYGHARPLTYAGEAE